MRIKINNSFLLVLAFMIAIDSFKIFIFTILCSIIHEYGHILAFKLCNVKINKFEISAIGGKLYVSNINYLSQIKQIFIYSLGIIFNLIASFLCHKIAVNGFFSLNFFLLSGINLILAYFNLLPIFILDGFNILKCVLMLFITERKSMRICNIISFITNFLLLIVGIFYVIKLNFSILMIALYLLIKHFLNLKNNSF